MKKATILLALLVACFAGAANAQTDPVTEPTVIGFDVQGILPMGDFADVSEFGFGGTAYVAFGVAPNFAVTGRAGYLYFGGKDIAVLGGTGKIKMNIIPILGGLKYFFTQGDSRFYGAAEAGIYMMSGTAEFTPTGGGAATETDLDSESKFGVSPTLGMVFKAGDKMNVDAHVNFTNVFTEGSSTNWVGFGIGFEWMMN